MYQHERSYFGVLKFPQNQHCRNHNIWQYSHTPVWCEKKMAEITFTIL